MIKVSVNDMQCVETRPRVHTFTSASPLNNNSIIESHNYPSTCNKESLQSSYLVENIRRNCLQGTKPPQSYSFRSIYSRVRTKITQSYSFSLIYPRVRTKITPKQIHIHNTQSNTKNFKQFPKICTEGTKDKNMHQPLCIDYPNVTSGIGKLSAKTYIK